MRVNGSELCVNPPRKKRNFVTRLNEAHKGQEAQGAERCGTQRATVKAGESDGKKEVCHALCGPLH